MVLAQVTRWRLRGSPPGGVTPAWLAWGEHRSDAGLHLRYRQGGGAIRPGRVRGQISRGDGWRELHIHKGADLAN
eukprot:1169657-Heterocapsa_arctica.AAC.1